MASGILDPRVRKALVAAFGRDGAARAGVLLLPRVLDYARVVAGTQVV